MKACWETFIQDHNTLYLPPICEKKDKTYKLTKGKVNFAATCQEKNKTLMSGGCKVIKQHMT